VLLHKNDILAKVPLADALEEAREAAGDDATGER
jgi:hypothetical protein